MSLEDMKSYGDLKIVIINTISINIYNLLKLNALVYGKKEEFSFEK